MKFITLIKNKVNAKVLFLTRNARVDGIKNKDKINSFVSLMNAIEYIFKNSKTHISKKDINITFKFFSLSLVISMNSINKSTIPLYQLAEPID
tara:strand:- start:644 stop:922 length:279 start_codon:yes stop_codon:yes gene_type:complete